MRSKIVVACMAINFIVHSGRLGFVRAWATWQSQVARHWLSQGLCRWCLLLMRCILSGARCILGEARIESSSTTSKPLSDVPSLTGTALFAWMTDNMKICRQPSHHIAEVTANMKQAQLWGRYPPCSSTSSAQRRTTLHAHTRLQPCPSGITKGPNSASPTLLLNTAGLVSL